MAVGGAALAGTGAFVSKAPGASSGLPGRAAGAGAGATAGFATDPGAGLVTALGAPVADWPAGTDLFCTMMAYLAITDLEERDVLAAAVAP